jgi:hypothetical protein
MNRHKQHSVFIFKVVLILVFSVASHPHAFFGCLLEDQKAVLYVDITDQDEDIFIESQDESQQGARVEYQEESRNDDGVKGSLKLKLQTNAVIIPVLSNSVQLMSFDICSNLHFTPSSTFPQKLFHPPQS